MLQQEIFGPMFALMYLRRRDSVAANKIALRELPVLFYAICFYLYAVAQVDVAFLQRG